MRIPIVVESSRTRMEGIEGNSRRKSNPFPPKRVTNKKSSRGLNGNGRETSPPSRPRPSIPKKLKNCPSRNERIIRTSPVRKQISNKFDIIIHLQTTIVKLLPIV